MNYSKETPFLAQRDLSAPPLTDSVGEVSANTFHA